MQHQSIRWISMNMALLFLIARTAVKWLYIYYCFNTNWVVAANKRVNSSSCCHQLKFIVDIDVVVKLVDAIDDMEDKLGDVTKI
jgi:hypothetical protein